MTHPSDAEIEAAAIEIRPFVKFNFERRIARAALEAAAKVRREQSADARLRAALKEIIQIYVHAPGGAAPIPDSGLMWKMQEVARAALAAALSGSGEKGG